MGRRQHDAAMVERLKGAVAAHEDRRADADVNVGGARVKTQAQDLGDAQAIGQAALLRHFDLGMGLFAHGGRGMRLRLSSRLFLHCVNLNGGGGNGGSRRIQRLAQALGLSRIDDGLFEQEIDGRKVGHGLKGGHGGMVLLNSDPSGVVGGGKNELVMLGVMASVATGDHDGKGCSLKQACHPAPCPGLA